jgi:transposase
MVDKSEITKYLGTDTDTNIGLMFGMTKKAILCRRKRLEIPSYCPPRLIISKEIKKKVEELLGRTTDSKIAARFNISGRTVGIIRKKLEIERRGNTGVGTNCLTTIQYAELLNSIENLTIGELTKKFNISRSSVSRLRKKHGKTFIRDVTKKHIKPKVAHHKGEDCLTKSKYLELCSFIRNSRFTQEELAKRFKCSESTIRNIKCELREKGQLTPRNITATVRP